MKQFFIKFFGKLGSFLAVLFKDTLQKELEVIAPIALSTVKQIAQDPSLIQPGEKRDAAINSIQNQLVQSQINIGLSVISLAIELAVQNLKQGN